MDPHHVLPQISHDDLTSRLTGLDLDFDRSVPEGGLDPYRLVVPDVSSPSSTYPSACPSPCPSSPNPSTRSPSPSPSQCPSPYSGEQWWSGRYDFAAKVIVLGDYGVGKTSLIRTLAGLRPELAPQCRCVAFRPNEFLDIECYRDRKKVLIRILDTGGQERFRSMTSSYFRGAHGCMLMFNVSKEESFDNIINWFNDLGTYAAPENVSSVVVGAMTSLHAPRDRRVTAERAFRLAESLNLTYCETSVHDARTVLWILTRLVNSVILSRVRRQSLAISIVPALHAQPPRDAEKKRWRCCHAS